MHNAIEWTSYDVIEYHMITKDAINQNSSKGKEESTLLRQGLSRAIKRHFTIFSLKSLLFQVKIENSS